VNHRQLPGLPRPDARIAPLSFLPERPWSVESAGSGARIFDVPLLQSGRQWVDARALSAAFDAVAIRLEELRAVAGEPLPELGPVGCAEQGR
jgi:hypothetical protein